MSKPQSVIIPAPSPDAVVNLCLDTLSKGKQALVFCNTKRGAESQAEKLAVKVETKDVKKLELAEEILDVLSSPTKQCRRLAGCVKKGVAFHHAGLHSKQRALVEDGFRSGVITVICSTPTLCLAPETLVWHGVSETVVSKMKREKVITLSGTTLLNIPVKGIERVMNAVPLLEISSVSGHRIKVTQQHRMLVKRKGHRVFIDAALVRKGDRIATIGRLPLTATESLRIRSLNRENKPPLDILIDGDIAYCIGAMLGDGYSGGEAREGGVLYKGSPSIVGKDEEVFSRVEQACRKLSIRFRRSRNSGGTPQIVLGKQKWFREFLVRCGVDKGVKKHIAEPLMTMGLENIAELLRGLFDTDGYAQRAAGPGFTNTSERLVRQVQKLLLRFGIVSRIRERKEGTMRIYEKTYSTLKSYELTILHKRGILDFYQFIGFNVSRKQDVLRSMTAKITANRHYLFCPCCNYKVYRDLFGGRTKSQKSWGAQKRMIIATVGRRGVVNSRELASILGHEARKNESRLNHHYELLVRTRTGKSSWQWSLSSIGTWIYQNIIEAEKPLEEFFKLRHCPLCNTELKGSVKKGWRHDDFEGDIYWDIVKDVQKSPAEAIVYDVVLPSSPVNDHLFVANGFIVHNSMGLDLPAFRVIIRDTTRFGEGGSWGVSDIPVLEYHQMAGRAGRPGKEDYGEAIVLAETADEEERMTEKYLYGEPEAIYSKLAVEPVLRTAVLSLVASGFVQTREGLAEFFGRTFYAKQYGDMKKLRKILNSMVVKLASWGFLKAADASGGFVVAKELSKGTLEATPLGKRVAELYLDPFTAHHLIACLERASPGTRDLPFIHMLTSCLELRPLLRPRVKELDDIVAVVGTYETEFLAPPPAQWEPEFEEFLASVKTALFLNDWVEETLEDELLEKYAVRPGEVHAKLERADWLIYSAEELARISGMHAVRTPLAKLRLRLKHGAKAELLPLLQLKGIGRVRARKLFNSRIQTLQHVKDAEFSTIAALVGKAVALDIKKQVGQEYASEALQVKPGKRKGQKSMADYGEKSE